MSRMTGIFRMKFAGGRFDEGSIPTSSLVELQRLGKIYTALAEDSWKQANPERTRVSPGFARNFELYLEDIGTGSTVPILSPRMGHSSAQQALPLTVPESLEVQRERAARRLEETFIHIVRHGRLPDDFPPSAVSLVASIFSSFNADEAPIFLDENNERFVYTQAKRAQFVNSLADEPTATSGQLAGRLGELDLDRKTARLEMFNGIPIPVSFGSEVSEDITAGLTLRGSNTVVILEGDYLIQSGTPVQMLSVDRFQVISIPGDAMGLRVRALLNEDPNGEVDPVSAAAAEAACILFGEIQDGIVGDPVVFAGEAGEVQMVWSAPRRRLTVTVDAEALVTARSLKISDPRTRGLESWSNIDDAATGIVELAKEIEL